MTTNVSQIRKKERKKGFGVSPTCICHCERTTDEVITNNLVASSSYCDSKITPLLV